jgi:uncharacterized damage-inducible protein DinB
MSLVIHFTAPSSLLRETDRPSQLPIVGNGPPGTFVIVPDGLRVSLPTDQIVSSDDGRGHARVEFSGMRFAGVKEGRLAFVRFREQLPEDRLSPARSHTMLLEPRWVADVSMDGDPVWPARESREPHILRGMLALFRDLFEHQAYADAAMLSAIRRHEAAARDESLRSLLHHTLLAHRFWLHLSQGLPFVPDEESKVPDSLDVIAARYRDTYTRDRRWLEEIAESDLDRVLESPYFEGRRYTVRDGLIQICLHSQGHRSQCASKLRALGGEPPTLDYVLWIKDDRPAPAWAES